LAVARGRQPLLSGGHLGGCLAGKQRAWARLNLQQTLGRPEGVFANSASLASWQKLAPHKAPVSLSSNLIAPRRKRQLAARSQPPTGQWGAARVEV